ncbi:MAG TPA: hypothetical protein PKE04_13020 [Clostridia bacterium]|nr:hypothetical protein [Clostridia bacterium]
MADRVRITYLEHSGFAVELGDLLMVFDDARGAPPPGEGLEQGHVTRAFIAKHARTFVFVSHGHGDHYDPAVYDWQDIPGVDYVLGCDMDRKLPGRHLAPGDVLYLPNLTVTAHASTDLGVSYLIDTSGYTFFHAGDLNLWHWRNESTLREIEKAEQDWLTAVAPLYGASIDFAFFPVDPRQGSLYDAGATHFVLQVKPRVFIPMHWQGRADVAMEFARRNRDKHTEVVALTVPGETLVAHRAENGALQMYVVTPDPIRPESTSAKEE